MRVVGALRMRSLVVLHVTSPAGDRQMRLAGHRRGCAGRHSQRTAFATSSRLHQPPLRVARARARRALRPSLRPVFETMLAMLSRSDVGLGVAGAHRVHGDALGSPSSSASARVRPIDAVLGRAVGGDVALAGQPGGARDVDDAPAARRSASPAAPPACRGTSPVRFTAEHALPQLGACVLRNGAVSACRRC